MPEIESINGPCDGMRAEQPMLDGRPALLVEVDLPARHDSLMDTRPSVPAETHLYRRVEYLPERITYRGPYVRVAYEWRGRREISDIDLHQRRLPRRP